MKLRAISPKLEARMPQVNGPIAAGRPSVLPVARIQSPEARISQGSRRHKVFRPNPKARLLDPGREVLRFHHFELRTEQTYVYPFGNNPPKFHRPILDQTVK